MVNFESFHFLFLNPFSPHLFSATILKLIFEKWPIYKCFCLVTWPIECWKWEKKKIKTKIQKYIYLFKLFQSDFEYIVSNYIMKSLSKFQTKRWIQKEVMIFSAFISLVWEELLTSGILHIDWFFNKIWKI